MNVDTCARLDQLQPLNEEEDIDQREIDQGANMSDGENSNNNFEGNASDNHLKRHSS